MIPRWTMSNTVARASAVFIVAALASGFAAAAGAQNVLAKHPEQSLAPFEVLETEQGAYLDLLFAPIRPLAWSSDRTRLLALNTHDSELLELDAQYQVTGRTRVPWGPVAVAYWEDPGQPTGGLNRYALVVCRGTYVLARVHLPTGRIAGIVPLPTEPADIVVHPVTGHAFVSCSGAGVVVEIDVDTGDLLREVRIPAVEPTFLTLDGDDVLVAPLLSGNNSTAQTGSYKFDAGRDRVLDLADPLVATDGLSDFDLVRIAPGQEAVPVATGLGTVLFAIGVQPQTGDVWVLNTEANNKDPARMGEPAIRGESVFNRLSIVRPSAGPGAPAAPSMILELDDVDPQAPGMQYDPALAVGQPYALAFDAAGHAYVAGLLTDNVTELDASGGFVREFDVGSIPRAVLVAPDGATLWVHCWGTNTVEVHDLSGALPVLSQVLDLGFDPTPELEREGRKIFYDGQFSMHGNASCNSCHIEADTDMIVWDLSDLPRDDKGPMVTQTLRGIQDLVPLHWRGERDGLIDFNGAFDGLLGGAPLDTTPGGEFDRFRAFLDSLHQPANPNEHPRRIVDGRKPVRVTGDVLINADAVRGQEMYFDDVDHRCNVCHTLPSGTANDTFNDESALQVPRRNHFKAAALNGLWRKTQPTVETITFVDGSVETRATTGAGTTQSGLVNGTFDFVSNSVFELTARQAADMAAYLSQVDSGIAPATHRAFHMDAASAGPFATWVSGSEPYLQEQARLGNIDLVVMGRVYFPPGTQRDLRWVYDRSLDRYRAEDSSLPALPVQFFANQALAFPDATNLFVGVPLGMGERFGVDFDADEVYNQDEIAYGLNPFDPDHDGDSFPDGHELFNGGDPRDANVLPVDTTPPVLTDVHLIYRTTRVAKFRLEASEPVKWRALWVSPAGSGQISGTRHSRTHTILVTDLVPNAPYSFVLAGTDYGGHSAMQALPAFTTADHLAPTDSVLEDLTYTILQDSSGRLRARIEGVAHLKGGGTLADRKLVVQVSVGDTVTSPLVYGGNTSIADGVVHVDINEPNLVPGDLVDVTVFTLYDTVRLTSTSWDMPATRPENRALRIPYTGNGP